MNAIKNKNVKIISDGGIKYSGDLAKAFAAGADAVMIGSLFAGTDETPGKLIKKNGKLFKSFRGMGSVGAMNKGSADRYFQKKQKDSSKYVPEGVEGLAKYKGKVDKVIFKLVGGLRSSMGYLGSKQIKYLRYKPHVSLIKLIPKNLLKFRAYNEFSWSEYYEWNSIKPSSIKQLTEIIKKNKFKKNKIIESKINKYFGYPYKKNPCDIISNNLKKNYITKEKKFKFIKHNSFIENFLGSGIFLFLSEI